MREIEELAIQIFSVIRPKSSLLTDYDEREDVLYINYCNSGPQMADFGRRFGDYIVRLKDGFVVGVTILNASEHYKKKFEDKPSILIKPTTIVFA
jgi:uncharacterized protein YuzE